MFWFYIILEELILISLLLFTVFDIKEKIMEIIIVCIVVFITVINIINKNDINIIK